MIRSFDASRLELLDGFQLRTSRYDRVSSLLISLLILATVTVAVMFALWWTAQSSAPDLGPPNVTFVGDGTGGGGEDEEVETPGQAELAGVMNEHPLTDQVSNVVAVVSDVVDDDRSFDVGNSNSKKRQRGPDDNSGPVGQRATHWEIRFVTTSIDEYARQLDFFGIELGVAGGGKAHIDYAAGFTRAEPVVRQGGPRDEKRLHMTWRDGTMQDLDRQLLERAGISVAGRVQMQFYPPEVESTLIRLEQARAAGRPVTELRRTVFGIRRTAGGCEIYVIDQW